jgi:hypothetical protein
MKKYFLIQCYNCEKRRRLMYQVQDTITGEYYHLTEEEWAEHKNDCYSYEETEVFRAELKARTYLQEVGKSKKRRRK